MEKFTISRNGKDKFTLTAADFHYNCEQIILEISQKLGIAPYSLPDAVTGLDIMALDEVDELLEHYFTFKFLAREYGLEIPEQMQETENYTSGLLIATITRSE